MARTLITPPAAEPVTLDEAKAQCRVDTTDEDITLTGLLRAARDKVESLTGFALLTQTWELVLDAWPRGIEITLPLPPLQSVTSITYRDSAGVDHTFAPTSYAVATASIPGRVVLIKGQSWPTTELYPVEAIRVRFVAGWAAAANVPEVLKLAIKLLVGHWFENREEVTVGAGVAMAEIPFGVENLVADYHNWTF